MGAAAYYRGSKAISESIARDYEERNGAKRLREQMERAEKRVIELENFCREAQSLYVDLMYPEDCKTLAKQELHLRYLQCNKYKKFQTMEAEIAIQHCRWVDSNPQHVFTHLQICNDKAKAYKELFTYLNQKSPFRIPVALPYTH
ncbi:hypothetical protein [Vibrio alginolyticus]|uniref:hypothetical protein n=1 Tax=Vibrio alginolyticus TaxID=663 RepID=UPI0006CAA8B7|nr:hypothetical protein [Vibrio alginolyticus]KPM97579.1 hypothetical protein AOG25_14005 [Vibrio alginolyticus]CAH7367279.1 conserved hypothetical protein [Vibrio chagasii]